MPHDLLAEWPGSMQAFHMSRSRLSNTDGGTLRRATGTPHWQGQRDGEHYRGRTRCFPHRDLCAQKALQFNQFLIVDEQPLLFHTGQRAIFPEVREAVGRLIDPTRLRWIGFSHFEMDECGSLNEWLALAPDAAPLCGLLSARLNVNDFALRPAHAMADDDVLVTGRYRFRFRRTPHVPHCWDAGLLFEETERTLLCSDLFVQDGDPGALTESDVVEPTQATLAAWQGTLLAEVMPYTPNTERILHELADLRPRTLAAMHGATFSGDGERALRDLALALRAVYGPPTQP